jgi:geranylgeranyl diphosphate synthase, type I
MSAGGAMSAGAMSAGAARSAQPAVPPDVAFVAGALRPYLANLLAAEQTAWKEHGAPWWDTPFSVADFLDGGKALRPRFCYWGYASAAPAGRVGAPPPADLLAACAALELLHAFALIHDDLMDAADTRRGRPTLHVLLAQEHRRNGWAGPADRYGAAAALLAGDLAFALAARLAGTLPGAARPVWDLLLSELTAGQFLDLAGTARGERSVELAGTIARLKSARYTVTGPLRLGAALAPAPAHQVLTCYGDLVGEAFQLRDDLLDVYGDPAVTGKPAGGDLRAGKPTLLLAYAQRCLPPARRRMLARVGAADLTAAEIAALARAFEECGAAARVQRRITARVRAARAVLRRAQLPAAASDALCELAGAAANRHR